jgi:hypothetical protein
MILFSKILLTFKNNNYITALSILDIYTCYIKFLNIILINILSFRQMSSIYFLQTLYQYIKLMFVFYIYTGFLTIPFYFQ